MDDASSARIPIALGSIFFCVTCCSTISESSSWNPMCCVLAIRTVVLDPTCSSNPLVTPPLKRMTASWASMAWPCSASRRLPPLPTTAHVAHFAALRISSLSGIARSRLRSIHPMLSHPRPRGGSARRATGSQSSRAPPCRHCVLYLGIFSGPPRFSFLYLALLITKSPVNPPRYIP